MKDKMGLMKTIPIIDYEIPQGDSYVVLESISTNPSRTVHIVNFSITDCASIGRGHDTDIRITDISVSRRHAYLSLDQGDLFLIDNGSKFGTLVDLREPIELKQG